MYSDVFKCIQHVGSAWRESARMNWVGGQWGGLPKTIGPAWVPRDCQLYSDVFRCIQMYSDVFGCIQMYSDVKMQ